MYILTITSRPAKRSTVPALATGCFNREAKFYELSSSRGELFPRSDVFFDLDNLEMSFLSIISFSDDSENCIVNLLHGIDIFLIFFVVYIYIYNFFHIFFFIISNISI